MNWLIFVLMLPHLKPKCVKYFSPELSLAIDVARVVSLFVIFILLLRKKKWPSPVVWLLGGLEGWLCLITLINRGDYLQTFSLAVSVMGIALLVDVYADGMKQLLTALMLNFEWLTYANLFTVVKWPDQGLVQDVEYNNVPIFFFGPDNWFMYLCIPAVCVALLYLRVHWNDKFRGLVIVRASGLIMASYACVLLQWPATAVVSMAVLAGVLLLCVIPGVRCCVMFPIVFVCGVAANLAIAVFRVMETVPIISDFIQNVLGKSLTLSNRTLVWDGFWQLFSGHLLTGIGTPNGGYFVEYRFFDHMHNQPFDLLIQGGVPALLLFLCVLLLVGKKLTVCKKTAAARLMTAVMAGFLMMCIPEVCRHAAIFLLLPLAYYVDRIEAAGTEGCRMERNSTGGEQKNSLARWSVKG